MGERVICIFGDSNTMGFWDLEKGGWVNRLRLYCDSKVSEDYYVAVYNLGVDGDDTLRLLKRFETECEARNPDVIIFDIGSNDSYYDSKKKINVSLGEFEENIKKLIKSARDFTKIILFVGLTPVEESKTKPVSWDKEVTYINMELKRYNETLKELVEKEKLDFIDVSDLISKNYLEDGVHLNSKGHEKMFQKIKGFLIKEKLIK